MTRTGRRALLGAAVILLAAGTAACVYYSQKNPKPSPATSPPRKSTPIAQRLDIGLPTANDFLFVTGRENDFFQPVDSERTDSGKYGCVRGGKTGETGSKFHEGIDIRCLQRDKRGEPTDSVMAIADGVVAYVNLNAGASNYGIYVVIQHRWNGAELYSLYAHLSSVAMNVRDGAEVKKGQALGVMGRTSTDFKGGIPKERAHVHLEIALMGNANFAAWAQKKNGKPIEHANFNGNNLLGLDAAAFFIATQNDAHFTAQKFFDKQTPAFTVLFNAVRRIAVLQKNPWLLQNPTTHPDASLSYYEITFDHTGLPLKAILRRESELTAIQIKTLNQRGWLLSGVNGNELARRNCRGLVSQEGAAWKLTEKGNDWMEMLSFAP